MNVQQRNQGQILGHQIIQAERATLERHHEGDGDGKLGVWVRRLKLLDIKHARPIRV